MGRKPNKQNTIDMVEQVEQSEQQNTIEMVELIGLQTIIGTGKSSHIKKGREIRNVSAKLAMSLIYKGIATLK